MSAPKCPHCNVATWPYDTVPKRDGVYHRYECKIIRCATCRGGRCTYPILAP